MTLMNLEVLRSWSVQEEKEFSEKNFVFEYERPAASAGILRSI
ncbi:MAG: hypothetical protein ACOX3L_06505 [Lutisporaceae bacterium]|jgi:hypothetical protein